MPWANITGHPTTIAGYGILDALSESTADGRYLQLTGGTLTGDLTLPSQLAFSTGHAYANLPGSVQRTTAYGLLLQAATGATYDFCIASPSGANALTLAPGTQTLTAYGAFTAPDFVLA